jgi:hypothetical protein
MFSQGFDWYPSSEDDNVKNDRYEKEESGKDKRVVESG